jgi:hypothetical protein
MDMIMLPYMSPSRAMFHPFCMYVPPPSENGNTCHQAAQQSAKGFRLLAANN